MGLFNIFSKKKSDPNATLFYHTDVHCHILPGVDHGSQDVIQSLEMLRAELAMGINRVVLTSHVTADTFENTPESLNAAFEILKKAVADAGLPIELHVSAEYRLDDYWNAQWAKGAVLPMPGNYLLLENSFLQERLDMDQFIFEVQSKGYKPILAHPERYAYYSMRRERLVKLHAAGVKFQVNVLSLSGYFGHGARDLAQWLIKEHMVDLLGSDMHNIEHAMIIKEYIGSKDWQRQLPLLMAHNINDSVV